MTTQAEGQPVREHGSGQPVRERGSGQPERERGSGRYEPSLTVDELAARAGVTVRTIRFYSTRGLLPPPSIGPRRVGRYGAAHLSRLALIEELQHHGLTLAAIERYMEQLPADMTAHDLAIHRALVASWIPEGATEMSREQLARRAGGALSDADVDRLAAMSVLERTEDPDTFRIDPGLLHLGLRLLDVPISHDAILAARDVMLEHSRQAARELTRLFQAEVWGPYRERESDPEAVEAMRSLSADMQPMVVQALVTAFQRSLKDELRRRYVDGPDAEYT
ncbi:MerR family transcriptional regulator [Streptomyces indicus]|uniref:DNA-binding transcriptional regulator, MerR family n=1 Tax=Streptomyces indicus TaxID=417292 RepID=A0A1G8U7V7_9ACTN|nr:MerR family transcriptional regulator [Streptomyces indicus]SDJ49714.1 DNA-binding transcriptional regulator, MerR family [Streptomyces indicus]